MADDTTKRGKADRARIGISQRHEVAHAAKSSGKTAAQVKAAVTEKGPMRAEPQSAQRLAIVVVQQDGAIGLRITQHDALRGNHAAQDRAHATWERVTRRGQLHLLDAVGHGTRAAGPRQHGAVA